MPGYGGFSPSPRRMGGGKSRVRIIFESLAASRGTSLDATNPNTVVYVETLALARAIAGAWNTNERLSFQWDARRMSPAMLTRWEKIFAIVPGVDEDLVTRRERIAQAQARVGRPAIYSTIYAELVDALGPVFVAIEFISPTVARVFGPAGAPFGLVNPDYPWLSMVAQLLIRVTRPDGYSTADFYEAIGRIADRLEPLLPAWVTWQWYLPPVVGAPVNVAGGPSAGGFYLDEPNLDVSVFAS